MRSFVNFFADKYNNFPANRLYLCRIKTKKRNNDAKNLSDGGG